VPELASQSTTIICIFLPLSAIWAGLISSDASVGSRGPDCHQRLFKNQFYKSSDQGSTAGSNGSRTGKKGSIDTSTFTGSGKDPESPTSPFSPSRMDHSRSDAIYIGREYIIANGKTSKEA
jgi:pheromone alpha factor receptor